MTARVGAAGYFNRIKSVALGLGATLPNPMHIYWLK